MQSIKRNIFCKSKLREAIITCRWILAWLVAFAITGCTVYQISVNTDLKMQDKEKIPEATSFFILNNPESECAVLHQKLGPRIEELLQENHYKLSGADTAEGFLLYDCGTRESNRVSGYLPVDPRGKSASPNAKDGSASIGNAERQRGTVIQVEYPRTVKGRWLIMVVIDAAEYRETGSVKPEWLGDASSFGADRAFDEVIGFLLEDTFKYFGRDSGGVVHSEAVEKGKN